MIFKYTKAVPLIFIIALVALTATLASTGFNYIHLAGDTGMSDAKYWSGRKRAVISPVKTFAPIQLPGPLDIWAGGESKEIEFKVPFKKAFRLAISFLDSHESGPPSLDILADGRLVATVQVIEGAGVASNEWWRKGKRSSVSVIVPKEYLNSSSTTMTLRNSKGSWAAIENITASAVIPKPLLLLTAFCWLLLFIFMAAYRLGGDLQKIKLREVCGPIFSIVSYPKRVYSHALEHCKPSATTSTATNILWVGLLAVALALPSNEHGVFNGLPFNGRAEALAFAIFLPLIFVLNRGFFTAMITRSIIALVIVLKLAILLYTAPAGACLQPYWKGGKDTSFKQVKTYEGFWADGCFPVNSSLEGTRFFPMEHYNRHYKRPDPIVGFSFYFLKPEGATALVIDTNDHTISAGKFSGLMKNSSKELSMEIDNSPAPYGFIEGAISYTWTGSEWTFIPYFIDDEGNRIKDLPYFNRFYSARPGYGKALITLAAALAFGVDALMVSFFVLGSFGALTYLFRSGDNVFYAIVTIAILWTAHDAILPVLAGLFSFFPERIAGTADLAIYILAAAFIVKPSRMNGKQAFALAFATVFAFYGPMIMESIGAFRILEEGNDWRTYQRFANVIFSENIFLNGVECPPTWNLPFAYFTALLHIIGGQSMFFQKMLDLYSLAIVITALYILGSQWGLSKRLAWISGLAFLYLHLIMGYYMYVGAGLTEHPSMLVIFSMVLMFAGYRINPARWVLPLAILLTFIAVGWRPNFAPWIFLSSLALLGLDENRSYKKFFGSLWSRRWLITSLVASAAAWIVLFMFRNYYECGQFVYISPDVAGLYGLSSFAERFDSVVAMVTMIPSGKAGIADVNVLYFLSVPLIVGWAVAMAGGVCRVGFLKKFPLGLSVFAWTAFLIYFFKFDINAGYGVRWGIPMLPVWILSFFFFLNSLKEYFVPRKS